MFSKACLSVYLPLLLFCTSCKTEPDQHFDSSQKVQEGIYSTEKLDRILEVDTLLLNDAPSRITRKIRRMENGQLMFATYDRVLTQIGSSFQDLLGILTPKNLDAFDAIQDSKGNTWIASTHHGVFRQKGFEVKQFTTEDGLGSNRTMDIEEDLWGNIWIATDHGLSRIQEDSIQNFAWNSDLNDSNINTILFDNSDNLWIGSRGGLFKYKMGSYNALLPKEMQKLVVEKGNPFQNVWVVLEDEEGGFYFGGQDGMWYQKGDLTKALCDWNITGGHLDKKGRLWVTHRGGGAHQAGLSYLSDFDPGSGAISWQQIFEGAGMFFGMDEDTDGNLWVGHLQGVFNYDGRKITYIHRKPI